MLPVLPGLNSVLKEIMAVFDEKWQEVSASITKRGIFMFNNELLSDVSLVVAASSDKGEPKKSKMAIPAHKFVLSICSPVFFAMFCGKLAERSDSVDLPDCEYEGVLEMLRYMYSGQAELNKNNVMQVLYVAKKYILPSLVDECIDFLEGSVNAENVFCILSHAQQYDEEDLVDECWKVIDRETENVMKSEGFATIERSVLGEIVKRDSLTIQEVALFKAVDLWATKECEKQRLTPDGHMKRKILGEDIVKGIRFPTMEEKEFANVVIGSEILTSEELVDIMKYFNSVSSVVSFPEKERVGALLSCCRFRGLADDTWGEYGELKRKSIDLSVDKDILLSILLHGIRMLGSENGEYVAMLKIIDRQRNFLPFIASRSGTFSSVSIRVKPESFYYHGFNVLFDCPVNLKKDGKYRVTAIIDGPYSSFGIGCYKSVQSDGVTFRFSRNEESDGGQFAEFLFQKK
ncbi:BTB/POZ domain-containing protein 6-B-like [Oculina patagonica]